MIKYSYLYIKKSLFVTILLIVQIVFLVLNIYNSSNLYINYKSEERQISNVFTDEQIYGIEFRSDIEGANSERAFSEAEEVIKKYLHDREDRNFYLTLNSVQSILVDKFDNYSEFKIKDSPEEGNEFYVNSLIINEDTLKMFDFNISTGRIFSEEELKPIKEIESNHTIPIIVGNNFKGKYNVGDSISLDSNYTGIIVGILAKNQINPGNIESNNRFINLDDYIIMPNDFLNSGAYLTGAALLIFPKHVSKNYINEIANDLRGLFYNIGVSIDVRDFSDVLYVNTKQYMNELKDKVMISIIITVFIFVSLTITLLNSILIHKKDFGVHYLIGGQNLDMFKVIAGELFLLIFTSLIIILPIFAFKILLGELSITSVFMVIFFIVFLCAIVLVVPLIYINKIKLIELIKGED